MIKKLLLVLAIPFFALVTINATADAYGPAKCTNSFLGIPNWHQYVQLDNNCEIVPPDQEGRLVILIILGVFDIVLYVAGFAAVIFVIWGGYKFLTSTGEPQKIASARTTILNALVGLAIAFIASNLVGFIAGRLG